MVKSVKISGFDSLINAITYTTPEETETTPEESEVTETTPEESEVTETKSTRNKKTSK